MVDTGFENLLHLIRLNDGKHDIAKIEKAYEIAKEAHKDQLRRSGEPYIVHPVAVATILVDLGMDTESLVAALLHDVVEDTAVTLEEIKSHFGSETALLVGGLTKLGKIPFSTKEEQQAENIRKMIMAMAADVRVIIIKLADRLHNMRTLDFMPPQKQRDISLETMEIYAPLAHRLGIQTIKEELEDIALMHLDPIGYAEIEKMLDTQDAEREEFLLKQKEKINQRIKGEYEDLSVEGRVKSIYGIYRKVYMQGRSFEEVYDIYAIRILVNSINECYNVLGEIHDMFRPIPNRFKDYISLAKPNGYQSLHTTVLDDGSVPFEIQIRTWEMHHTAEFGIAAHWKYKEGVKGRDSLEEQIAWIRQTLETQKDSLEAQDVLSSIKTDLSTDEVFLYTPKRDVISLPKGATVIDFAYAIHSEVGNKMTGAKIDGRMVSLDTSVSTGNIVDIITNNSKNQGPSRDWINIVKTSSARNKIRNWFKKERREENVEEGKNLVEKEFQRYRKHLSEEKLETFVLKALRRNNFNNIDDFYAALGYGGISSSKIIPRLRDYFQQHFNVKPEEKLQERILTEINKPPKKSSSGVIVQGADDFLVKFARCCNPLPGDNIIGYITRGHGVSVHKQNCVNVTSTFESEEQRDRWIECEWSSNVIKGETFKSTIGVISVDRDGLLVDISVALNKRNIPVYSLVAREVENDATDIQITIGVKNTEQINDIIRTLKAISGVKSVTRTMQ